MASPIRIAFVLLHLEPGGLERVLANVMTHLDRDRFAPSLVLLHGKGELADALPEDVEIVRLAVRSRYALPALVRALRALRPDVVFSGIPAANFATILAARRLRPRPAVVVNEHTAPRLGLGEKRPLPRFLYRLLMRVLYPRADRVGVPLLDVGEELREVLGRPDLRIVELLNPVIDDRLEEMAREEPSVQFPAGPTFVAAGRLVPEKGYDLLLDALARMSEVRGETPGLVLLGEGPERTALERRVERLGLGGRVVMPGLVSNPYAFFARARALVVSSRREATPNVIVEAMACGTPVVAVECWTGPRRVLEDGAAGLLVPPGDSDALAAAMTRVLEDRELAARLAERGRVRARDFHLSNTLGRYQELFEELAAGAAAVAGS